MFTYTLLILLLSMVGLTLPEELCPHISQCDLWRYGIIAAQHFERARGGQQQRQRQLSKVYASVVFLYFCLRSDQAGVRRVL